jgi:predicted O-linked N-acetylglucosamine transferase (SPINDLY family)
MVADLGAKVIFEVQKPLLKLLEDLPGVSTLIAKGDQLPEFDYHCPLMSLPLAFKTELKSIPFAERYLKAEPKRVDYWRGYLKKDAFKIGIGWQGSQGTKIDIGRSFDLKLFQQIAEIRNVQLVSLQKGYGSEQLKNMPEGMQVTELGEKFDKDGAFLDTAAVMMNLDLVITSDTALAHLAGALGVKTWVALKYVPDWRWMLGREDSPWYPSLTLYRQPEHGEWVPVFDQMKRDLNSNAASTYAAVGEPSLQEAIDVHQQGKLTRAKLIYRRLLELNPKNSDVIHLLGLISYQTGQHQDAVDLIRKAIGINPKVAMYYSNLGIALKELKLYEDAVASYDTAISLKPDFAEAYSNRGNALKELQLFDEALISCDKAIAINPSYAEAHSNRGNALQELKKLDQALSSYDNAIALNPNLVQAFFNRGIALKQLRQFENAVASFDQAIALRPDHAEAHFNRGSSLQELKRLDEAIASYDNALSIKKEYEYLQGIRLHAKMHNCDWINYQNEVSDLRSKIKNKLKVSPALPILALPFGLEEQRIAAEIWCLDKYPRNTSLGPILQSSGKPKIRLGYFSADFRNHPVSLLSAGLFEHHDKSKFELIAFAFGPDSRDKIRDRIAKSFDKFFDVKLKTDKEIAALSREMGIDIAIDLGGHTQYSRIGVFSFRAAPIQLSYIGYLGTMGANYYDYLIADKFLIPEKSRSHYIEKIIYLPSYQVNDNQQEIPCNVLSRQELNLPSVGFVYCCFNASYKITPETFDGWMRILRAVPQSVLMLYVGTLSATRNLRIEAEKRGVSQNRLIFGEQLIRSKYLARCRSADLFLDTLPYNAGATASDALWAGLPVLTCMGEGFAGRYAASLLQAIGLPELITNSQAEYEALAIELGTNSVKLKKIKEKLELNRMTEPLFDTALFAKKIEIAYEKIYEIFQSDLPPQNIYIA